LAKWIAGPLRPRLDALLAESRLWEMGFLRRETFVTWQDEHNRRQVDRSRSLWALLVLDRWVTNNL
jgi:hypothetical protein